jgi:hypothetical protein
MAQSHRAPFIVLWSALALLTCSASIMALGQTQARPNPNQLMHEVVDNEVKSEEQDHSHWLYRKHRVEHGKDTVKECVDTDQGSICRLLAVNGRLLTPEEQKAEMQRIRRLLSDPREEQKQEAASREDADRALQMLKMLPDAFTY